MENAVIKRRLEEQSDEFSDVIGLEGRRIVQVVPESWGARFLWDDGLVETIVRRGGRVEFHGDTSDECSLEELGVPDVVGTSDVDLFVRLRIHLLRIRAQNSRPN